MIALFHLIDFECFLCLIVSIIICNKRITADKANQFRLITCPTKLELKENVYNHVVNLKGKALSANMRE